MPVTTYRKLLELTIPTHPGAAPPPASTNPGGAARPANQPADKAEITRLLRAGKAYGIVHGGDYKFVVFYNAARRGWSVALNSGGNWQLWGTPQTTVANAFAQVATGL